MTTRKIIAAAFIILCSSFCVAQRGIPASEEQKVHKKSIANTDYIFEGTVIKQEYFRNKKGETLTCSVVQIARIYKGSPHILLGTIRVISDQGGPNQKVFDGGEGLNIGNTYIIFGKSADSTMSYSRSMSIDNLITIDRMTSDQPIRIIDKKSAWWYPQKFTLDSIHSFFNENGLIIQQEVK